MTVLPDGQSVPNITVDAGHRQTPILAKSVKPRKPLIATPTEARDARHALPAVRRR
jgi:hypothetical protein